jgi:hypothetical protein
MAPSGIELATFRLVAQILSLMEKDCLVDLIVDRKFKDKHDEQIVCECELHTFGSE